MGLGKWLKRKMAAIAIATASVEESALKQTGNDVGETTGKYQRHNQGSLADDLKQGVVTQQVQELRWRMYKVLEETQKYKTKVVGYDEDGFMITETVKDDGNETKSVTLSKINVDDFDDYKLELVVNNDAITMGVGGAFDGVSDAESIESSKDEDGDATRSIGLVDGESDESHNKTERIIECGRELRAKFQIEDYTKKMNIRTISETEKLLEFYVSIYPDEYNRKSRFFLSEIAKAVKNPRMCDFLDIQEVMFVSYNTIGVKDLMEFEYKITRFDKIVDYNGYHVIKFKAEVVKNGDSIYEKFEEGADELIDKYKNKEKKNNGFN